MANRKSARNAVKHGLCSLHFLAEENQQQISDIRLHLEEIHKPLLAEEHALIDDLAVARFKMYENERVQEARLVDEKLHAGDIYNMQILAEFQENQARWRDTPIHYRALMESSMFGCRHFLTLWQELQAILRKEHARPSLEQVCEASLTFGNHWQIQLSGPMTRLLVGLYLAMQANPEQEINHWVEISQGSVRESNVTLAHEIYAQAPIAAVARQQLRQLVDEHVKYLEGILKSANKFHELARQSFIDKSCGLGLTDPARSNEARLFQRYYVSERNHALKIERMLQAAKRQRMRHHHDEKSRKPIAVSTQADPEQTTAEKQDTSSAKSSRKAKNEAAFQASLDDYFKQTANKGLSLAITPDDEPAGEFSQVDWGNFETVTEEQEEMLMTCDMMDPGPDRNALIAQYFGTETGFSQARLQFAEGLA